MSFDPIKYDQLASGTVPGYLVAAGFRRSAPLVQLLAVQGWVGWG